MDHREPSEERPAVFHSTAIVVHREQENSTSLCYLVQTGSVRKADLMFCAETMAEPWPSKVALVSSIRKGKKLLSSSRLSFSNADKLKSF